MTKACACIPEVPKIVDGDLYAYVDILDTPNGRLLKTLVDYGFVPGISSRGSGDIMANDEVDPETFFLETWDIVQLPAVRKARLTVCESVDTNVLKLKKALSESLNAASDEDKKPMQEALDNLKISLTEGADTFPGGTPKNIEDIPFVEDDTLLEDAEIEPTEDVEEIEEVEETEEVSEEKVTVGEVQDTLTEVEPEAEIEIKNVEIDGQEYEASIEDVEIDEESGNVKIGVNCEPVEGDSEDKVELEDEEVNSDEEATDVEPEGDDEEAEGNGDDEIIESLKEVIRQKDALEKEVKSLRNEKTVGDAKEKELQEELAKYKAAFARTSELAAKATKFESEVKKLTEQLTQKDIQIKELNCKADKAKKLNESIDENANKVRLLTEKLATMQKESEELESNLNGQIAQRDKLIKDRTAVAKKYKTKFVEAVNKYVESKASMLGVRPIDITSKLGESYTLADIDRVCDDLLESTVSISRLPFSGMNKPRVKVSESVNKPTKVNKGPEYGYEIDDSLLELAGLKK
jgi:DNA repair exonuclease SbcCD ATPase subunit